MGVCRNEDAVQENQDYGSERKRSNKKEAGQDPNYPNMEEREGNSYKGVGIKRMKGYKYNLPINKFNEQLEKFWMTKNGDGNRRIIQQICVFDKKKGEHNFGSNLNYSINKPYFEQQLSLGEKKLTVLLYQISGDVTEFSKYGKGENFLGKKLIRVKMNIN